MFFARCLVLKSPLGNNNKSKYVCILAREIIVNNYYSLIFIIPRVLNYQCKSSLHILRQAELNKGMVLSLGGSLNTTKTKTKGVNLPLNMNN